MELTFGEISLFLYAANIFMLGIMVRPDTVQFKSLWVVLLAGFVVLANDETLVNMLGGFAAFNMFLTVGFVVRSLSRIEGYDTEQQKRITYVFIGTLVVVLAAVSVRSITVQWESYL